MDKILIAGLRELGVHGVLPEEQGRPQPFEVDVELDVDLAAAGESDHLDETVDYSAVAEAVSRGVKSERYHLLERLGTLAALPPARAAANRHRGGVGPRPPCKARPGDGRKAAPAGAGDGRSRGR